MRCSNIGPRGARNWFRVLDSPRQLLSPHHQDMLAIRRPASASWVLREAKQVAPTTRLAGPEPSKSRCAPPGRPLAVTTSLNFKEPLCVLRRDFGDFLWAEAVNLGELFGDVADVGGLVALAAMRDGSGIRTVGLYQDAVQRDRLGDVAQHRGIV